MICPKTGCRGTLYRFRPKHLVAACHHADTGVLLELEASRWTQIGLVCGTCGFMEFYTQNPSQLLAECEGYFESTEAGSGQSSIKRENP